VTGAAVARADHRRQEPARRPPLSARRATAATRYHSAVDKDGTALIIGIVLLLATLAVRSASANRHVRSKLNISGALFAAYAAAAAVLAYVPLAPGFSNQVRLVAPLLLAYAAINLVVVLAINPWRVDRIPERFPNIVQDAIIIAIFAVAATLILQDRILTTTAVGAVVIGLALQDTLGNLFAGLAIQVENPFRVGHWVTIAGREGMVSQITWRATKIRTKSGNFVVVPNSVLARDAITNYSEPTPATCLEVEVGASYEIAPNAVKAAIHDALRNGRLILHDPAPEVLLVDFAASSITYRVRVWTTDFAADERVKDQVRSLIYYAFRRRGITIPFPIRMLARYRSSPTGEADREQWADAVAAVEIFASLDQTERRELLEASRPIVFAAGETIVHEAAQGSSMFVILSGQAVVTLAQGTTEVARLGAGGFFGEMSLLTGEPRSATVTAATDCVLLEIGAAAFRRLVIDDEAILARITSAVAKRRGDLEYQRTMSTAVPSAGAADAPQTLLARVRRFFRL
jgi:small-conductance mechanosensitive channel/CRP-like cAMP-binding protein